jgi:hypothetical protein
MPLANELFDNRAIFRNAMSRFEKCQPIVPYLQPHDGGSVQVERELQRLLDEAAHDPERHRQLAAVRFYLRFSLTECQRAVNSEMRGVTNYKTLLDQIRHFRTDESRVCIVTFNYDTLVEDALPSVGVTINTMDDYVTHDFVLIKIHGSVDWGREVHETFDLPSNNLWQVAYAMIARADSLQLSDVYHREPELPIGRINDVNLFPAIAIPLETKLDFECPQKHLETLCELLPRITKVLVIGWRGTDAPFIALLRKHLRRDIPVYVVAGSQDEARQTTDTLNIAGISVAGFHEGNGFSDFIVNRAGNEFLAWKPISR